MAKNRLDTFVPPQPSPVLIRLLAPLNRLLMLHGIPLLRDIPVLDRIPGFRGLANIRHLDFPAADRERLAAVLNPRCATFVTPNHPEFFTDWMIDKEIASRFAPMMASWATGSVVNGMGVLAQRFWLANNLIAQIPGNSAAARAYSVDWALQGRGVLLHPEGAVGWHGDWVAPLMPGAAQMALEALRRARADHRNLGVWIAPVVWKLVFTRDVEQGLQAECSFVEKRLDLRSPDPGSSPADRVFGIYDQLLARDEAEARLAAGQGAFQERLATLIAAITARLAELLGEPEILDIVPAARRWMRQEGRRTDDPATYAAVRSTVDTVQRLQRLGDFAWSAETMTQEHVAEHLKRLRSDHLKRGLRDTLGAFIPQPVGPRRAHIRVPEPLAIDDVAGAAEQAMAVIRGRMQGALDQINRELASRKAFRNYPNPFYPA